ncbi:MAG: S-layer homology domain-containing protein [Clostridia bacterium]|nr:S-layer homology domain-containing protein [Clostridia bacterium]
MSINNRIKRILSGVMAAATAMSIMPSFNALAAQSNEYVDPADRWVEANGRANEFDVNATTTYETSFCPVCDMETTQLIYRVPEYTKSGETALNRGVMWSDGTGIDGVSKGNVDSGTPGVDAFYTGYHYTKSVCQNCGVINANDGTGSYGFGKNVYGLNPCDHNFFQDFDNTTYTPYNSKYHTTVLKKGEYCQFCKGTFARATEKQELHDFDETVDAQLGNQRFHITAACDDCGYIKDEYVVAKSVVESYYGKVDGNAHSVVVSDLSEDGVNTSIRYGTEASSCNKTSAPSYTEEGYYPVYYQITYSYNGERMTENGVSYVWLLEDKSTRVAASDVHTHDYRYIETVKPTCTELGYERWQCNECGALEKKNYTPATGHNHDTIVIREASCTQGGYVLHMCKRCGDYYTENTAMTGHDYETKVIPASCTMNGYTEHVCKDCGYKYITDLTPLAKHEYQVKVTAPTCTTRGFTTYTCANCDDVYISDYTEPTGHEWDEGHIVTSSTCDSEGVMEYDCNHCDEKMIKAISATGHTPGTAATCTEPQICTECGAIVELPTGHEYESKVTAPTCTSFGFTAYVCKHGDSEYVADYVDKLEHNYKSVITAPTCTEMGYTTYTCPDCGDTYKSDYMDKTPHHYESKITAPTCTEMGYTTYTCHDCGDSYVADYTDVLPHNYHKQTIEPTCTSQGYTIYTCPDCGKEFIGDEKESIAHNYVSVVTAPTCTEMGYTTYTCSDCGDSHVASYTDALGHEYSDWIIDTPATIERDGSKHIECTRCGNALRSAVIPQLTDKDNSDEDGRSVVGKYTILIADKDGKPVFNSEIRIDTNDNITIKLPDGRLLSAEDITTITVIDADNQPAKDVRIYISDTSDNAATGISDENGQLRVPNSTSSITDSNGTVTDNTNTYVVVVTDKNGELVPDCDVTVGDNYSIDVKLPEGTAFNKDNRITVTVVTEKGEPVKKLRVQLIGDGDYIENGYTNVRGQLTLPMTNTDITDDKGTAEVGEIDGDKIYDYIVTVYDETGVIPDALVTLISSDKSTLVCLPADKVIDYYNRITVKVTKSDGTPVEDWKVTVYNKDGSGMRTEVTDENGIVIVPPLSEAPIAKPTATPVPDAEATPLPGVETTPEPTAEPTTEPVATEDPAATREPATTPSAEPEGTEKPEETSTPAATQEPIEIPTEPTPIPDLGEGAVVQNKNYTYRVYVWDNDGLITEFGLIKLQDNGDLVIELPESKMLTPDNKTYIKVVNETDSEPIKGVTVTVTDTKGGTASDKTKSNGIAVVPQSDADFTDADGNATVKDANGNIYNVNVSTETKGNIENAYVVVKDGKVSVMLPNGVVIDYADRTTVTVTDKDNAAVKDMSVTVTDKTGKNTTKTTGTNGKIVVPDKPATGGSSSGGSSGGGRSSGGGGGGSSSVNVTNVKVTDKNGKTVTVAKSTDKDGNITLTLPNGTKLDGNNYYTITVTDGKGNAKADTSIILKDKDGNSANGTTDKNGQLVLPATEHKLYVIGYNDGTFRPEGDMTRAEAAAIFARNIAERKGENIGNKVSSFKDVDPKAWYNQYISYLASYKIIEGYTDGTFKPDASISRAEFLAMCTRFYELFDKVNVSKKNSFADVTVSHWAESYVNSAVAMEWINGYADGTFKPDNNITRAEVVAIVNRVTGREADTEYINKNITTVNPFTDLKDNSYWAYFAILEAANTHMAVTGTTEEWVK